jgi:alpha-beta hydrolase superfamily lysophospholipase
MRDVAEFSMLLKRKHPQAKLVVMGESMGAAVALNAIGDGKIAPDKLVLSAPAIWGGSNMNPFYRTTLTVGAHLVPGWQLTGSDLKIQATDNIPLLRQMSLDPLIIKSTRLDSVYGLVRLMGDAFESLPSVNSSVLLLYGGKDQVIPPSSIEVSLARFPQPLTFAYYPGGYHMLTRDVAGARVMADIAYWIYHGGHELPSGMAKQVDPKTAR